MSDIREIIGNTTATPNPRPDWNQDDSTKADYIKNKPKILNEEEILELIGDRDGDIYIQADWAETDDTKTTYIKNKPDIPTDEDIIELIVEHAPNAQIQADWTQVDDTKLDYIKNKPDLLTEDDVKNIIDQSSMAAQVQADWDQNDDTQVDYIKNKPDIEGIENRIEELSQHVLPEVTSADNGKSLQVVDGVWQPKLVEGGEISYDGTHRIKLSGSGDETLKLTFDNNTVYEISGYSHLEFVCPDGEYGAYFYITLPNVDDVSIVLPGGLPKAGDRVNGAQGGDTWEISIDSSLGILSLNVRVIDYE